MWAKILAAVALCCELFSRDDMFVSRWPIAMKVVGILSVCLALFVDRSMLMSTGGPTPPAGAGGFAFAAIALAALLGTGCPGGCQGEPGAFGPRVADCSRESVRQNWPKLLPAVNDCLVSGSFTACLLGLVNPGIGMTEDLVSCVVRARGSEFAAMAQANPEDRTSSKAAENARAFIAERGWTFADEAR